MKPKKNRFFPCQDEPQVFAVYFMDDQKIDKLILPTETYAIAKRIAVELNKALRASTFKAKSPGRHARSKGHGFERECANDLLPIFPQARRQLEYHKDDAKGIDIQNTGDYKIQCKRFKNYASISCIEEVQCDRGFGDVPVLVTQANGKEPIACLYWSDFIRHMEVLEIVSKS